MHLYQESKFRGLQTENNELKITLNQLELSIQEQRRKHLALEEEFNIKTKVYLSRD